MLALWYIFLNLSFLLLKILPNLCVLHVQYNLLVILRVFQKNILLIFIIFEVY